MRMRSHVVSLGVQNLEEATEEERVRSEREKRILFSSRKKTVLAERSSHVRSSLCAVGRGGCRR